MYFLRRLLSLCCLIALGSDWAYGAFVHGNYIGPTVDFSQVTETNSHEPELFWEVSSMLGDTLLIDPVDFRVDASDGPKNDFLDSQLDMVIQAKQEPLAGLSFAEFGDYFITGNASVSASLNWFLEIPNSGTAAGTLQFIDSTTWPSHTSSTWSLALDVDLLAGTANGEPLIDIVTGMPLEMPDMISEVSFEFGNTLFAGAGDNLSTAFIAKEGTTGIIPRAVPEPSGILLALLTVGMAGRRYRGGAESVKQ